MALIRIEQTAPSPTGEEVPAAGVIEFTATRRRTTDTTVIQRRTVTIVVPDTGLATVHLAATAPDWCWEVHEKKFGAPWERFYVVVPDQETAEYSRLTRVDPMSMDPGAAPEPAWWAELAAAKALAADVEAARAQAVQSADTATGAAALATQAATEATEARDDVVANRVTAWPDPDNPDLIIISYPAFALAGDGTSIIIPLEVD